MIKLYKQLDASILYWEAWATDDSVVVHTGEVGDPGNALAYPVNAGQDAEAMIDSLAAPPLADGYSELDPENSWTLIVQHQIPGEWGDDDSLRRRHEIEDGLNQVVGWIGAGELDGGDIGSGTTNVFLMVVDAPRCVGPVVEWLRENGHLNDAIIAADSPNEDEKTVVLWPTDYTGQFRY